MMKMMVVDGEDDDDDDGDDGGEDDVEDDDDGDDDNVVSIRKFSSANPFEHEKGRCCDNLKRQLAPRQGRGQTRERGLIVVDHQGSHLRNLVHAAPEPGPIGEKVGPERTGRSGKLKETDTGPGPAIRRAGPIPEGEDTSTAQLNKVLGRGSRLDHANRA